MPEYRAYLIGEDGHFYEVVPLVCADDSEAIEKATRLADKGNVELWERTRKVAAFERKCEKSRRSITHEVHHGRMISKPAK